MPHSTTTFDTRKQAIDFIVLLAERRGTRPAYGVGNTYGPGTINYRDHGQRSIYVWVGALPSSHGERWTINYREVTA